MVEGNIGVSPYWWLKYAAATFTATRQLIIEQTQRKRLPDKLLKRVGIFQKYRFHSVHEKKFSVTPDQSNPNPETTETNAFNGNP